MKTKYTIAVLLLTIVVANISLWIYTTTQYNTFLEMKAAYYSYFPNWLADYTTHARIILLAIAIPIFALAIQKNHLKSLSVFLMSF